MDRREQLEEPRYRLVCNDGECFYENISLDEAKRLQNLFDVREPINECGPHLIEECDSQNDS